MINWYNLLIKKSNKLGFSLTTRKVLSNDKLIHFTITN